jgi:hypothetical protein
VCDAVETENHQDGLDILKLEKKIDDLKKKIKTRLGAM